MDEVLKKKELELERLEIDKDIASRKTEIEEQKSIAKKMKKSEGKDWKKILGASLKPNAEAIQTLYSFSPELKELSRPRGIRKL